MPEIVLSGLKKKFGDIAAADGIDLTVKDGEYLCVLGPTGSGKTTCLRMICGLTLPDSGTISFDGKDVTFDPVNTRKTTMLSQTYSLFQTMDVYGNVVFSPKINGWSEEETKQVAKSMIHLVHMDHKVQNYPSELSGGQQQRTALARALTSDSKVLLLDEPLRALDARLRLELRKELKSMVRSTGMTLIHVTHDQDEALDLADRIAIIRDGRIIQVGTPTEVFQDPVTPFVANFVGRSNNFFGKVVSSGERTIVELKDGSRIPARGTDIPPGTEVLVTIKVGSTRLTNINDLSNKETQTEKPEGYLFGIMERMLYEGATFTAEVDVEGVGRISAKLPNRKYDDYNEGDRIAVAWIPDRAVVFEIPPEGLDEELRLD